MLMCWKSQNHITSYITDLSRSSAKVYTQEMLSNLKIYLSHLVKSSMIKFQHSHYQHSPGQSSESRGDIPPETLVHVMIEFQISVSASLGCYDGFSTSSSTIRAALYVQFFSLNSLHVCLFFIEILLGL
jgi:hypothetical protein